MGLYTKLAEDVTEVDVIIAGGRCALLVDCIVGGGMSH